MADARRVRKHLETELRRVEGQLREMGTEPTPLDSPLPSGGITRIGDFYDLAMASEAKEMAYEIRSRLVKRLADLREALHRLRDGTYGQCGDCGRRIPERRLLAMPEATLCVPCQERRERAPVGH